MSSCLALHGTVNMDMKTVIASAMMMLPRDDHGLLTGKAA